MVTKLERDYRIVLSDRIYDRLPGQRIKDIMVVINDPNQFQGIPDLSVFYQPTGRWAMLEVKREEKSKQRPNQGWYIEHWGRTIFTAVIHPGNEEEVLSALQHALGA